MDNEISMSLYDLNKSVMAAIPVAEDLTPFIKVIEDYYTDSASTSYMLLCKEISYYTIFQKEEKLGNEFKELSAAVLTCAQDVGQIVTVDKINDHIEIWVRTAESEHLCMILFDCSGFIVTYGG